MVGRILAHYKILKVLGTGGMGEVYQALDQKLNRTVALKILPKDVATDGERMRRFAQEARAASALDHPNVAHIYEVGEAEGIHFIAMQYVEGETLNVIMHDRPLPVNQLLDISIQVADALAEAHSKGVVHRDVKPANIMLNSRGQIKVVDFGLAKVSPLSGPQSITARLAEEMPTRSGVIIGTIHYLSPEQALGRNVGPRSDLFALGVVMYQMATGRLPFGGDTALEMMNNILKSEPVSVTRSNPQLPKAIEQIILKCLAKDPQKRYQSADELLTDLKTVKRNLDMGFSANSIRAITGSPRGVLRSIVSAIILSIVATTGYQWYQSRQARIDSIAVMPFSNASRDQEVEYISDGITENVINSLSQIPQLRVMARSTVFMYKGKQIDPREIGHDLNVGAILTGTVLQRQDSLTVQAELVDVRDGSQIWGDQFSGRLSDILRAQEEIARQISENLKLQLTGEQEERLKKHYTENTEAYQLYLKGRYYLNKRTGDGFQKAIESFEQSIALDPQFALAYAGLADCYTLLPAWALIQPSVGHSKAIESAKRALELDEGLAEAHTAIGHTLHNYNWEWQQAEKEYRRAIELNPNYALAHHWYSNLLSDLGRTEEAIAEKKFALRLDPLSLVINADLGNILYHQRRYDQAIEQLKRTLELDENFALAYQFLGYLYEQKGRYDEEIAAFRKALKIAPDNLEFKGELARALALSGKKDEAQLLLSELLRESADQYVVAFNIAMIYFALQENDTAFQWLNRSVDERSYQTSSLNVDPRLDPYRSDQRLKTLISRLNLPTERRL